MLVCSKIVVAQVFCVASPVGLAYWRDCWWEGCCASRLLSASNCEPTRGSRSCWVVPAEGSCLPKDPAWVCKIPVMYTALPHHLLVSLDDDFMIIMFLFLCCSPWAATSRDAFWTSVSDRAGGESQTFAPLAQADALTAAPASVFSSQGEKPTSIAASGELAGADVAKSQPNMGHREQGGHGGKHKAGEQRAADHDHREGEQRDRDHVKAQHDHEHGKGKHENGHGGHAPLGKHNMRGA